MGLGLEDRILKIKNGVDIECEMSDLEMSKYRNTRSFYIWTFVSKFELTLKRG